MASSIIVLQNGDLCRSELPLDVITEINKVVNQNQMMCEVLAIKHCRLQHRLTCKLGSESRQLRFYRRRDLRHLFESAEDILWHYWSSSNQGDVPDFHLFLTVQEYVKALLDTCVDCAMMPFDEGSRTLDSTTCSLTSSSSTSADSLEQGAKERVSVHHDESGIELQLELFSPRVTFSEEVTYHMV